MAQDWHSPPVMPRTSKAVRGTPAAAVLAGGVSRHGASCSCRICADNRAAAAEAASAPAPAAPPGPVAAAAIESPVAELDLTPILRWYTGKALAQVKGEALPLLEQARQRESWPPGASRRVRALLLRQSVAERFGRRNDRREHADGDEGLLVDVGEARGANYYASKVRGWTVVHAMSFGNFAMAPEVLALCDRLASHCVCDAERAALETARGWARDFLPIAELVALLDATRPKPVYVFQEISRTVSDNVGGAMGLEFSSVRVPEIRWTKVEEVDPKTGRTTFAWVGEIIWPLGTLHDRSLYAIRASCCHACGHRIYDPYNWIPLVADPREGDGPPSSLWVAKDCARHLFGVVVHAQAKLRGAPGDSSR